MRAQVRRDLDVTGWKCLSFQIKGTTGQEQLRLADRRWSLKEDPLAIGSITDFLPNGVTTDWQEVVIPFSKVKRLDLQRLASFSFEFTQPGVQEIQVDHICLKKSADSPVPKPRQQPIDSTTASIKTFPKAMWIWSTAELIENETELASLFQTCRDDNIKQLWIQVPYSLHSTETTARCELKQQSALRRFIARATTNGIEIHALDGYPEFALRLRHSVPLAVVDAVIEFKRQSKSDERFLGVHLDNEPYLLLGWQNDAQREQILQEFLSLNATCQQRLRRANIKFGIDIPFWWNSRRKASDAHAIGSVVYNGVRKPASQHCIDLLDNVGIMNYRDNADGADGLIAHGQELLKHSDSVAGADIFMGGETFRYAPQEIWFVLGLPQAEFDRTLNDRGLELSKLSRLNGLKMFHMLADGYVHVGIEHDHSPASKTAIAKIAACFGAWSHGRSDQQQLDRAQAAIEKSGEWRQFTPRLIEVPALDTAFSGFVATRIMPSKVTFADNAFPEIARETRFAEEEFGRFKSYRGIAFVGKLLQEAKRCGPICQRFVRLIAD